MSTIAIDHSLRASVSSLFTVDSLYEKQYNRGGLYTIPRLPQVESRQEGRDPGEYSFGSVVSSLVQYASFALDTSNINDRYMVIEPLSSGAVPMRPLYVVTHAVPHSTHYVRYIKGSTDANMEKEDLAKFSSSFKNLMAIYGSVTKASTSTLLVPFFERAIGCYWSILFNAPAAPLNIAPADWSNVTTWSTHGGQLHSGPAAIDPLASDYMGGNIPIHLPDTINLDTIGLGLTLLSVATRSHFYPIPNGGNPFSNYYFATPGAIKYLSTRNAPAATLTQNNITAALRELAVVGDILGLSSADFDSCMARALRAIWVVPDAFTLDGIYSNNMFSDESLFLNPRYNIREFRNYVSDYTTSALGVSKRDWIVQQLTGIIDNTNRYNDMVARCDAGARNYLAWAIVQFDAYMEGFLIDPKLKPSKVVHGTDDVHEGRGRYTDPYIMPITFFGYGTSTPKYDWWSYFYNTYLHKLTTGSANAEGSRINVSYFAQYNLTFLGAFAISCASTQNIALSIAPVTPAQLRGGIQDLMSPALIGLETNVSKVIRTNVSASAFASSMRLQQIFTFGFSVIPPSSSSQSGFAHNYPRKLREMTFTFTDPLFVLTALNQWTPQLGVLSSGVRKARVNLRMPTLGGVKFEEDSVVDIRTMIYRTGLTNHCSPRITSVVNYNAQGYEELVNNTPSYSPNYLAEVFNNTELIWRLIPSIAFDNFDYTNITQPVVPLGCLIVDNSGTINVPDHVLKIAFFPTTPDTAIPSGMTGMAKEYLRRLAAFLTPQAITAVGHSEAKKEGIDKAHLDMHDDKPDMPNVLDQCDIRSIVSITPSESISQVGNKIKVSKKEADSAVASSTQDFQ